MEIILPMTYDEWIKAGCSAIGKEAYDELVRVYGSPYVDGLTVDAALPDWAVPEKTCNHAWIEVGFTHSRIVCKHCDQEKA